MNSPGIIERLRGLLQSPPTPKLPDTLGPPSSFASPQDKIVSDVLRENPGMANLYKPDQVSVLFAQPDRLAALRKIGQSDNQLEYWPPDETGSSSFPRPAGYDGKHILEIYSDALKNNPDRLKRAVFGDLLHGMSGDSAYKELREQFIDNYSPQIIKFNRALLGRGWSKKSIDDMYIRGRLAQDQGDEWNDPNRYSPKQLEILDDMRKYLSTGRAK